MRYIADFVGGSFDGELRAFPDGEVTEIEVPQYRECGPVDIGFAQAIKVEVTYVVYVRDELPKAVCGDVAIYCFRLTP